MIAVLAAVDPLGLVAVFVAAAVVAWLIGKRAGILNDELPAAERVQALQFWVPQKDARIIGPFPAVEIKSMIAAGILSETSELLTSPDAAPVPASAYPWLVTATETPQIAPAKPEAAAPMTGLQKAGLVIFIVGAGICVVDIALGGFPGLLSLSLLIIGFCIAVVGSCIKAA